MLRTQFYTLFKNLFLTEHGQKNIRTITTSVTRCRDVVDRREMLRSMPKPDEGAVGEKTIDVDAAIHELVSLINFFSWISIVICILGLPTDFQQSIHQIDYLMEWLLKIYPYLTLEFHQIIPSLI